MGDRFRLAVIAGSLMIAGLATRAGAAPGDGSGDIEMDPDTAGSGSGSGSGSATDAAPEQPAQPVKDPKVAKKWLAAATTLVAKGDAATKAQKTADAKAEYDNAVTAYLKAIEVGDDIGVYYALALAEDKAGSTPDAIKHLKLVVATTTIKPDIQKKAKAKLEEVSAKVGLVTLTVEPEGTAISLAGNEIGESPLTEPLVLMPGTYTVSFAAAGYQPKDAEIKVEAGSESQRTVSLEPIPVVIKKHVEDEPTTIAGPSKPSILPIYIGSGATGLFVIVATITGIDAIKQHHTFTAPNTSTFDREDAQTNGRNAAHATDICLGAAVVAAAFTGYWYWYKYRPRPEAKDAAPTPPKVDVIPWVQPDASGLVVAGWF